MSQPEQYVVTPITDNTDSGFIFKMECEFNAKAITNQGCQVFTSHEDACIYLRTKLEAPAKGLTKEDINDFLNDSIHSIILSGNRHKIMVNGKESPAMSEIPAEKDIERPEDFPDEYGIGVEDYLVHYPEQFFGQEL